MTAKQKRYYVHDRHAATASELRPKSTSVNPRYLVWDRVANAYVDEATTKYLANQSAADFNAAERES